MASRFFRPSRLIALALVAAAVVWIVSGHLGQRSGDSAGAAPAGNAADAAAAVPIPIQKVGVTTAVREQHSRTIVLSCVTKADHRAQATARGAGTIVDLAVSRGTRVTANEVIGTISDEGRASAVQQAQALLDQRQSEYDANKKLIDTGDQPRNTLPSLDSAVKAAQAALAAAEAEADRSLVRAPINGIVNTVPMEVGQAVQAGNEIAEIVDPDPMLAVGNVSEARRSALKVGQDASIRLIDGTKIPGSVQFVSLSADTATRTYPVEVRFANADAVVADGVTCEMTVTLEPIDATPIPRSALVFSDAGQLGVRVAGPDNKAMFMPIDVVEDSLDNLWVTGLPNETRVIVVGQDFVKDGDPIEAVSASAATGPAVPPT